MRRQIPFALVFIAGIFMVFQFFVPHESSEWVYEFLLDWIVIIGIFALALGIWSLFSLCVDKIKNRKHDWAYSYVTLAGLFCMILFGFTARVGESFGWYFVFVALFMLSIGTIMQIMMSRQKIIWLGATGASILGMVLIAIFDETWNFYFYTQEGLDNMMFVAWFQYILIPILSTMFALLAFFISSAAYRAFRARNLLATLLLISALILMLRFFPYFPGDMGQYMAKTANWLMNVPNLAAQRAIVIGIGLGIVSTAIKVILGIERGYMGKG